MTDPLPSPRADSYMVAVRDAKGTEVIDNPESKKLLDPERQHKDAAKALNADDDEHQKALQVCTH